MNNIYIVGFMATGKSAVGRELAQASGRKFLDLDELIEKKEKKSIHNIFAQNGELYFRGLEKQALKDAAAQDNLVVACGGGIVIDPENIRVIKETGKVICLMASVGVILKRSEGYKHRPLLNVSDRKKQIESLLEKRAPFYSLADQVIDTSSLAIKEVVNKILQNE